MAHYNKLYCSASIFFICGKKNKTKKNAWKFSIVRMEPIALKDFLCGFPGIKFPPKEKTRQVGTEKRVAKRQGV